MRLLTTLFAALLALTPLTAPAAEAPARESAYDRVMRTGTLRCGYLTWPKLHNVDVGTGAMSGMWHDYIMEMGHQLGIKIEWSSEISPSDFIAALENNRIDAMCAPIARLIPRMRGAAFTAPLAYIAIEPYVRYSETRFAEGLEALNNPDVRLTSMEGEFNSVVARLRFPQAQIIEFPAVLGPAQGYMNVADGKADVVFADALTIEDYLKNNPGKLRALGNESLGVFGGAIAVAGRETPLLTMLDAASRSLVEMGYIEQLIRKYGLEQHMRVVVYPHKSLEE